MSETSASPTEQRTARSGILAVLLVAFIAYAASLANGFPLDDVCQAKAWIEPSRPNVMVNEIRPLATYFTTNYWHGNDDVSDLYRPITVLSYALTNASVGRLLGPAWEAVPHRLLNVLLHLLATWLVFRLVRPFVASPVPALAAAAVFGLHALPSEAVIAIVGRADLLAFCFGALALLAAERARGRGPAAAIPGSTLAATLLFLAFCSKESALAWAPFLAVHGMAREWQRNPAARRVLLREVLRAAAIAVVPLVVFFALRQGMIARLPAAPLPVGPECNSLAVLSSGQRVVAATPILVYGLCKAILPHDLACYYGAAVFDLVRDPFDVRFLGAGLLVVALIAAGLLAARRRPLLLLAVGAFFGLGFITSNVPVLIGVDFAERLYYLPCLGVAFLAAWLLARVEYPCARRDVLRLLVLGAWLLWSLVLIQERNVSWRDSPTLFLRDVLKRPRSSYLLVAAGNACRELGELERARDYYRRATAIVPDGAFAWVPLAIAELEDRNLTAAEAAFEGALAGARDDRERATVHHGLGLLYEVKGELEQARTHHAAAFRLDPTEEFRARLDRVMRGRPSPREQGR